MPLLTVRYCESAKQNIEIFYDTFGDVTAGQPLLLVMGLGTQMVAWDVELCEKLVKRGFYVIRYDNRDVGLSSHLDHCGQPPLLRDYICSFVCAPKAPYTLKDMAHDGAALLDKLNLPSAHICGVSMGGVIAQIICVEFPQKVSSLTCISTPAGLWGGSLLTKLNMLWPNPTEMEALVKHRIWLVKQFCTPQYWDDIRVEKLIRQGLERSTYRAGCARHISAIMAQNYKSIGLDRIRVPTLVIHGKKDTLVPVKSAQHVSNLIPGSRVFLLEEVVHDIPLPLFDVFADEISKNSAHQ